MAQIRTKTKTKKKLWRSSSRGKGVAPTRWDDVRAGGLGRWWWWWCGFQDLNPRATETTNVDQGIGLLRCCALMLDARLAEPSRDPPPSEDLPRFDGETFPNRKKRRGEGDGKAKHTTRCENYWVGQRSTTSRSRQGRIETKRGFLLEPQPNRVFFGANSGQWTRILTWGRWFSEKPFALESRFSVLNGIIMMKKNKK